MPTPSIQTLTTDAQQVLNLDAISAVRSVVAVALANANTGTPLNPNLTTQQLWDQFYQVVTRPKSDIESIIANQLMKFLYSPPAPGGAGADKQVIFNDGGVLAGDADFLWNKTTNLLTVTGSATITGDLTVDTSTLKVDSANNRVGIVNASPSFALDVNGAGSGVSARISSGSGTGFRFDTTRNVSGLNRNYLIGCDVLNEGWFSIVPSTALGGGTFTNSIYNASYDGTHTWNDGAGSERMRLNSTGLGVGGSPVNFPNYRTIHAIGKTTTAGGVFQTSTSDNSTAGRLACNNTGVDLFVETNHPLSFYTNATVKMTLDASGNLLVGTTSALQLSNNAAVTSRIANLGTGSKGAVILRENEVSQYWGGNLYLQKVRGASTAVQNGDSLGVIGFGGFDGTNYVNTGIIQTLVSGAVSAGVVPVKIQVIATSGGVELTNTATAWAAISDERLKDIIEPISNAVAKVGLLRSVIGKYKTDSEGTRRSFLIAQDVKSAIPEAVGGDDDSMTVRYTEVIPLLVAAIKELTARVQTLETR